MEEPSILGYPLAISIILAAMLSLLLGMALTMNALALAPKKASRNMLMYVNGIGFILLTICKPCLKASFFE